MKTSLSDSDIAGVLGPLQEANQRYARRYPGESEASQPLHTVYGGAQLFKAETTQKLGELALAILEEHAPSADILGDALGIAPALRGEVYQRVIHKLEREPVEDFRIDFEDGYGNRPDAEEDATAVAAAEELARGMREKRLPSCIGIRVKPLNDELKRRSVRTLDIFISTLLAATGGELPEGFVVTLPKVPIPEQVSAFVTLLEKLEKAHGLRDGALRLELMIELTQSIFDHEGRSNLPRLVDAAKGRCRGAHFGTYDYTASCNITAEHQVMDHRACDFAKEMMKIALSGTPIWLSDGATNVMPTGPHRGADLDAARKAENTAVVHAAWRTAYGHIRHSLVNGFYQGWDLHPGQLPIRYAACFNFFLESLTEASARLKNFIAKAAQATLVGDVFDDAATGQGLLNYFLRALNSGAITETEVAATGLTLDEIQTRSFVKILDLRRGRSATS